MKRHLSDIVIVFVVLSGMFIASDRVYAVLGGSVDTVESDRIVMSAVRGTISSRNGYSIHEFKTGATLVREYVSPSGVVFGIAWNGLVHADLDQLLASYVGEYKRALQQNPRKRGQRSIRLKTASVIVEKWGHMRNLRGRAYDPALIPSGVSADEIR